MRDIALMMIFTGAMAFALRRQHLLPLIWMWLSLMNPHRLTWGFAYDFPFAYVCAIVMLLVFPFGKERHGFPRSTPSTLLLLFYAWVCVTSLASFNTPSEVFDMWLKVTKIQLMLFVTLMMLRGRYHIELMVWVMALSIGFFGFKGGIFTISKGGTSMVLGPPGSFIEDTNHLAMAMTLVVPLMYYLAKISETKWIRVGLYVTMGLTALAVMGTTSRGALLGVCAMGVFLGFKSGRPVITTTLAVLGLAMLATMMSDEWMDKMGSIATYEDHSAQSRLYTWQMIWNMVLHHPLTGGGYVVTENPLTWHTYAVTEWLKPYSAHSIYFQALGEHGFPGLILYLALGYSTWRLAKSVIRRAGALGLEWAVLLMGMCQASLVGFAVGGAFVNLVNFDLPYYIVALVILTHQAVREAEREQPAADTQVPPLAVEAK